MQRISCFVAQLVLVTVVFLVPQTLQGSNGCWKLELGQEAELGQQGQLGQQRGMAQEAQG